jgi:hypothetical protein
MSGLLADLSAFLASSDPAARVIDWRLALDPAWPSPLLVLLLALAALVALVSYGSRGVDLGRKSRAVLGVLRALALAAPIAVLARPHLQMRLERATARTLLFLVDGSGSMGVKDGPEAPPPSRWERAVEAVRASYAALDAAGSPRARDPEGEPEVGVLVFDEESRPLAPRDLESAAPRPPGRRTALGDALEVARARLAARPGSAVILLSDGADNASSPGREPLKAARDLARAGVRVDACLVGSEHPRDLTVGAWADAPYAFSGDPVPIHVRLEQEGFEGSAVTVTVADGDRALATRDVTLPREDKSLEIVLDARLEGTGRKWCRVEASALEGELTWANNTAGAEIFLVEAPLKVLYVEKYPRWQFRFLSSAMRRDEKLDAALVLLTEDAAAPPGERLTGVFPSSPEEISRLDAIVIGDVGPQDLPPDAWRALQDQVAKAGAGLVLIAGSEHNPRDIAGVLGPLLPFESAVAPSEGEGGALRPRPTTLGARHPLMRLDAEEDPRKAWGELPPIEWAYPARDVKPGALVLAEVPGEARGAPQPLVILQRVGRGTVVFVGTDETWKWRYQLGNKRFYGFWGQVLRHAGLPHRAAEREPVRITLPPGSIAAGSLVPVTVAVEGPVAAGGVGGVRPGGGTRQDPMSDSGVGDSGVSDGGVSDSGVSDSAVAGGRSLGSSEPEGRIFLVAERQATPGSPESPGAPAPLRFDLERGRDERSWQGRIRFPVEGSYRLAVEGLGSAGERIVQVAAAGAAEAELSDPSVRPALLREIAALTGGQYVPVSDLPQLISRLDLSPLRERWSERKALWDGWGFLCAMAVLLTIEWVLRKWRYLP